MLKNFTFILFFLSSLSYLCGDNLKTVDLILEEIIQLTASKITKKHPEMTLIGIGGAVSEDEIIHETLSFDVRFKLTKDEGIRLINEIVEEYLRNVSSEKRLSRYLIKNPFTYKNLKIELFTSTRESENVYHPDIAFFTLENGIIYFSTIDESMRGFVSRTKLSYQEAVKKSAISVEKYEDHPD